MPARPNDWQALIRELTRRAAAAGQPINGTFELTSRCNLACSMCYVREAECNRPVRDRELSAEQWVAVAKEGVEAGLLFLLLTGGEVLVRPDFFDIYAPLARLGLYVTVFTNGTLITAEAAARFAESPPNRLEITLYGASEKVYEAVTGVPGSFRRCLAGIEHLLRAGVCLGLRSTLCRTNIEELPAMEEMARRWGLRFAHGALLTPRRDGRESLAPRLRLPAEACVELESSDPITAEGWCEALREPRGEEEGAFYCGAGKSAFFIGPSGEMNTCIDLPRPQASVTALGFRGAWEEVRRFVLSVEPSPVCSSCPDRRACSSCPAHSLLESGDLQGPVPYLCEIARERKRRFGRKTA